MIAGFTGTRHGMSDKQFAQLREELMGLKITELHHGCCMGGDFQANYVARRLGLVTIGHPPDNDKYQAECIVDEMREPLPYIERNHNIVDTVKVLFVGPYTDEEVLRSGTWAIYRYAIARGTDVVLLTR